MNTLFLAWQSPTNRLWFPVGRLSSDKAKGGYMFEYIHGALEAEKLAGFRPLPQFPEFERQYVSDTLFPLFQNRVFNANRRDFTDYVRTLGLDPSHIDPMEILALTGGERQTDSFEVFPKLLKEVDNSFTCRFFLHGLRHVSESAQARVPSLCVGDELRICVEL